MFECKIYNGKPKEGDFVVVKISNITKDSVDAEILELKDTRGIILLKELSRRRFRNINHVVKVGKVEVCQILKIEEDIKKDIDGNITINNFIELSLKKVDSDKKAEAKEHFSRNKLAYQIVCKASKLLNKPISKIYEEKCYEEAIKHKTLYNYFVYLKDKDIDFELESDEYVKSFKEVIEKDYKPSSYKIRADIDLSCPKINGLALIKQSLDKAMELYDNLSIVVLNTPTYSITKVCKTEEEGFRAFEKILAVIRTHMEENNGIYSLLAVPQVYGDKTKNVLVDITEKTVNDLLSSDSSDDE